MKKVYILRDMENRKSSLSRGIFDKCSHLYITFREISLRSRSNVWCLYYSDVFDVCILMFVPRRSCTAYDAVQLSWSTFYIAI